MLCMLCKKNTATIHIQEVVNGEKKALHICADCAAKKSKDDPVLQGFNLAEMLYSLSSQIGAPAQEAGKPEPAGSQEDASAQLLCQKCGWDSTRFRKTGRLGCADCYKTFSEIVSPALANMHRGVLHTGKIPGLDASADQSRRRALEIMKLQKELEDCVRREDFERAAVIRDEINKFRSGESEAPGADEDGGAK